MNTSDADGSRSPKRQLAETPGVTASRRDELIARANAFSNRVKARMAGGGGGGGGGGDGGGGGVRAEAARASMTAESGRRASFVAVKESSDLRSEVARLLKDNEELRGEREGLLDKVKDIEGENEKMKNATKRRYSRSTEFRQQFALMKDETWMDEEERNDLRSLFAQLVSRP